MMTQSPKSGITFESANFLKFKDLGKIAIAVNADLMKDSQGGVENYVQELVKCLIAKKLDVVFFDTKMSERPIGENEILVANRRISNYKFLIHLAIVAMINRKQHIHIIHVHRPEQIVPFLFTLNKRLLFVSSVHGPARIGMAKGRGRIVSMIYNVLETIGLRAADAVIFVDRRTHDFYLSIAPWLKEKSYIVPAGVSERFLMNALSRDIALKEFGFEKDDKILCFIGRLDYEKNVNLILKSFAKIIDKHKSFLVIAGEGELREPLMQLSSEIGIRNQVKFLGEIPHKRIKSLLTASEAMILASKFEGSPLVIKEAIATGTRIISTDVGDISELIGNEDLAIIIPSEDENELAAAMRSVLIHPLPKKRPEWIEDYSWNKITERIIRIYRDIKKRSTLKKRM